LALLKQSALLKKAISPKGGNAALPLYGFTSWDSGGVTRHHTAEAWQSEIKEELW